MGKTSPYTGTQKKANKAKAKTEKYFAEESVTQHKHDKPLRRSAQHDLRQISKGKYAPPTNIKDLTKEFEGAQKYAGKAAKEQFKPMQEKALSDYQRYTTPSLAAQYSPKGSAAKQALKDSGEDLQRSLANDFAGLKNSIAGNYMNQLSQNRNQDINTRLQGLSGTMGQPISPVSLGMQPAYNQKQGGTSGMGGTLIAGGLSAAGQFAGSEAGAAAIASLFASSREVKENIEPYEKGLEAVRDMDVKIYDYIGPVDGRQTGRVGLIAEEMPEELQGMIGDVKAVDVYGLVAVLVNAVKQLDEKVKILEAR